jgi:hypothetical protein
MKKCNHCNAPAVIHSTELVGRVPHEKHFCAVHARGQFRDTMSCLLTEITADRLDEASSHRWSAAMQESGLSLTGERLAWKPDQAVPAFARLLNDENGQLRFYSVFLLGQLGSVAWPALPALRQRLGDPDEHVRRAAAEALRQIER